jgi:pimeloyl-ACP methyl ester carboxylesterase
VMKFAFSPRASARLVELAARRMLETSPAVLHADFLACDAFDEMSRVDQINKPTLIICGSDDQMTPIKYAQFLAYKIEGAVLEIIPGGGHMVMLEKPGEVAAALQIFLAECC